jgi:hypothetical protein
VKPQTAASPSRPGVDRAARASALPHRDRAARASALPHRDRAPRASARPQPATRARRPITATVLPALTALALALLALAASAALALFLASAIYGASPHRIANPATAGATR